MAEQLDVTMIPLRPNFLIVGAAKTGTTALYEMLSTHPDVFLCTPKEPRFFSSSACLQPFPGPGDDLAWNETIRTEDEYLKLFSNAPARARAIGEASPDTLYYFQTSIARIRSVLGAPKIIILIRDPLERAYSAYLHLIREGRERLSFEDSLALEPQRIADGWEFIWHFRAASRYAEAISAFRRSFDKVLVLTHRELLHDTHAVVSRVCSFLEISDQWTFDSRTRYNATGVPKSRLVHRLLTKRNPIKSVTKHLIPSALRKRIKTNLINLNLRRDKPSEAIRRTFEEEYRSERDQLVLVVENRLPW